MIQRKRYIVHSAHEGALTLVSEPKLGHSALLKSKHLHTHCE